MKRVLCLWLPHWPLQRLCLVQPELKGRPVVLSAPAAASGRRAGDQVRHCSRAAVAAGVRPGMPLAEAQAILERPVPRAVGWVERSEVHPNAGTAPRVGLAKLDPPYAVHIAPHNPQADRKLLQLLAGWCARHSPLIGLEQSDEPSSLFFDITGCAPLFGGEEAMAAQIARDFQHAGYFVHIAVADTLGAAWAAARFCITHSRTARDSSNSLPKLSHPDDSLPPRGGGPGWGGASLAAHTPTAATIVPPGQQSALLRAL